MQWDITFQLSKVEDFVKDFEERDGSRIIKLVINTNCQHLCIIDEVLNPFKVVMSLISSDVDSILAIISLS
jgi:hypothetical protein